MSTNNISVKVGVCTVNCQSHPSLTLDPNKLYDMPVIKIPDSSSFNGSGPSSISYPEFENNLIKSGGFNYNYLLPGGYLEILLPRIMDLAETKSYVEKSIDRFCSIYSITVAVSNDFFVIDVDLLGPNWNLPRTSTWGQDDNPI